MTETSAVPDASGIAEALRDLVRATKNERGPEIDPTKLTTDAVNAMAAQLRREAASARELVESRLDGMDIATKLVADQVRELPTSLRAQFDRDLSSVRAEILALRELFGARLDGMDTATRLLAENLRAVPSDIQTAISALREIMQGEIRNVLEVSSEKFTAIEGTFASNALALTAALAAQKEAAAESVKSSTLAIDRANAATKETIAANASQTEAALTAQAANIGDLKERVVRLETSGVGTAQARSEHREDANYGQADHRAAEAARKAAMSLMVGVGGIVVAVLAVVVAVILHG